MHPLTLHKKVNVNLLPIDRFSSFMYSSQEVYKSLGFCDTKLLIKHLYCVAHRYVPLGEQCLIAWCKRKRTEQAPTGSQISWESLSLPPIHSSESDNSTAMGSFSEGRDCILHPFIGKAGLHWQNKVEGKESIQFAPHLIQFNTCAVSLSCLLSLSSGGEDSFPENYLAKNVILLKGRY